jgi:hypothetical protein
MRFRRGSLLRSRTEEQINTFEVGDVVKAVYVPFGNLHGAVVDIDYKENKVYVAWNGAVSQHDPSEISLYDPIVQRRMAGKKSKVVTGPVEEVEDVEEVVESKKKAMYHKERGRIYKMTKKEMETGSCKCPRCKCENMSLHPFTKSNKIYICDDCGWKITTDSLFKGVIQ